MLLIYSHTTSSRLQYTCKLLFQTILGIDFELTTNSEEYNHFEGPKFCYGDLETTGFTIKPHSILFEQGIRSYDLSKPEIFQDPLALAFYVVSRHEEYLPFEADEHGRFDVGSSILFSKGLLKQPYIHQLAEELLYNLKQHHPELIARYRDHSPKILIDIDQAFSYLGKGLWWSAYMSLKNLLNGKSDRIMEQWKVKFGALQDPFDAYEFLKEKQLASGIDFLYFIHCGDRGKFDKVLPLTIEPVRQLIKNISTDSQTGIHPSYYSNQDSNILHTEILRLKQITGKEVSISRQHYLRLFMPFSYHQLMNEGIYADYSMGYAKEEGFRSGMCVPYPWYDLSNEIETPLIIHPVCFMEGIFAEEKRLSPGYAWRIIEELMNTVSKYHGQFISAWHNHTVTDQGEWKGWQAVFVQMLEKLAAR